MDREQVPNFDAIRAGDAPEWWLLPQIRRWDASQVADYLGVSRVSIVNRIAAGHMKSTRFDGRHLFTSEQVPLAVQYHRRYLMERGQTDFDPYRRTLAEPLRFELEEGQ